MNRIESLFSKKQNNLLSVYFTAGFPHLNSTCEIIKELSAQGADMVEVGIPFSDPIADGKVIQSSSSKALKNGMNLHLLLEQVSEARSIVSEIPIILMGYVNPILQYGKEEFFMKCVDAGVDALIIPDLPLDVYIEEFKSYSERYDVQIIMLISPETSDERIYKIDNEGNGFIYMVSSASTTGTKNEFTPEQISYFERINAMGLKHKRLIGFGISNKKTKDAACANSSGAIIGSLFIKCLESEKTIAAAVAKLMKTIKE